MHLAVVGGGISGLAAAIELAESGRDVTVFERAPQPGGRGQSDLQDGFVMNLGPHALYPSAERRLAELGVGVTGGIPSAGLLMEVGDRVAALPVSPLSLLLTRGLGWADKLSVGRSLGALPGLDAASLDRVSVHDWLQGSGLRGQARDFLLALIRLSTYINAPHRLSAGAAVRQLRAAERGVRYVHGGWNTIVCGLTRRADDLGVVRRLDAHVERVRIHNRRAVQIELRTGRPVEVDGVVLTLSPKACVRLLGSDASEALARFAADAVAVRAACLDVALRRLPRAHPALILGTDRPDYLSVHSHSATLAPDGGAVIHLARYLSPGEPIDGRDRAALEMSLDRSQPGWRTHLAHARWSPAMTVMHALPEARFGGLGGRPESTASGAANVVLAGDWVGPDHLLLDAALASAHTAAAHLVHA